MRGFVNQKQERGLTILITQKRLLKNDPLIRSMAGPWQPQPVDTYRYTDLVSNQHTGLQPYAGRAKLFHRAVGLLDKLT